MDIQYHILILELKKKQEVNLQRKKIWSHKQKRWIKIKIATRAIKSFHRLSLYI